MKKFFTSLLALAGMVVGFTLTSCDGGGSGDNMSGLVITVQTGVTYSMVFDGKIRDVSSLVGLIGSVSADTIDADDTELFFHILSAYNPEDDREEISTQALYAPARFEVVKNGALVQMQWKVMALNLEDEEGGENDETIPTDTSLFTPIDLAPHEVIAVTKQ